MNKQNKLHDDDFKVQILKPPFFEKTGQTIDRREAWKKGLWYGAVNLWIISNNKVPSIVYQQRSPNIGWAPGKLDVSSAEHYEDLDTIENALDKIAGEIGKRYELKELTYLGKKLNIGIASDGSTRNTVNDIYFVLDNGPIENFILEEKEVYALCRCPISELFKVHTQKGYTFTASAVRPNGEKTEIEVSADKFPDNFDNYHFKIVQLANRFVAGEPHLVY